MADKKNSKGGPLWKKGDPSPNPSGKSKYALSPAAINKALIEYMTEPDPFDRDERQRIQVLFQRVYEAAVGKKTGQPSTKAISELFDRMLGRPPQAVTLDANVNVTREQRLASIEELLRRLDDGERDRERIH